MKKLFREYDIRGIADSDLTSEFVFALGQSIAEKCLQLGEKKSIIGRDVRASSNRLWNALCSGLESKGMECISLTEGPTPLLYFAAANEALGLKTKTGIMITGSHNPAEYNGFKMVLAGKTIYGEEIQELYALTQKHLKESTCEIKDGRSELDLYTKYCDFVKENILSTGVDFSGIKVVVDAGNGAAGPLAIQCYEALGCDVIPLFCDFDSSFPNHHPDPTVEKNLAHLKEKVIECGATMGIAYDGDGDRIGAVSSTGKIFYGDQILLYLSREILKTEKNPTIISEVKSSETLYTQLREWGATPICWKTGHSLIKAKLKETKALLAGEMSGHIFFAHRYFGFDDAIYSGARMLEAFKNAEPESLDEFLLSLPKSVNTPELRVEFNDEEKFNVVTQFVKKVKLLYGEDKVNDIDGARVKLHNGWGLLRASNTQPVLVMRFEAGDRENLKKIRNDFHQVLSSIHQDIEVPAV